MMRTLDFLVYARNHHDSKAQFIEYMQMEKDSKIPITGAWIGFDSKNKLIWEYPREGELFSSKINPLIITYDSFFRFMDCEDPFGLFMENEYKSVKHEKYGYIVVICADNPENIKIPDFDELI